MDLAEIGMLSSAELMFISNLYFIKFLLVELLSLLDSQGLLWPWLGLHGCLVKHFRLADMFLNFQNPCCFSLPWSHVRVLLSQSCSWHSHHIRHQTSRYLIRSGIRSPLFMWYTVVVPFRFLKQCVHNTSAKCQGQKLTLAWWGVRLVGIWITE